MRIFDWGSVAKNRWFISDGTHYTSAGYAARARLIAGALAQAFPSSGQNPGCVVSLGVSPVTLAFQRAADGRCWECEQGA
jgi:hypothetical protein